MEHIRVVHEGRIPWRAWLMVLLCLVAGPWIFFLWNQNWPRVPPGADGFAPNAAMAAKTVSWMQADVAGEPITDILVILYANTQGKRVQLDNVCVRAVPAPDSFLVSQLGTEPVLVRLGPKAQGQKVEPNQAVNLTGAVQVENGRAYIEADHVQAAGWY